jgi:hypothetical protein
VPRTLRFSRMSTSRLLLSEFFSLSKLKWIWIPVEFI